MQTSVSRIPNGFDRLPLCRSYATIHVAAIHPGLDDWRASPGDLALGVGTLPDGHCEVLGVWPLLDWQVGRVSVDLLERGMARVDVLVSDPSDGLGAPVLAFFPGAVAAPRRTVLASLKVRAGSMKRQSGDNVLSERARRRLRRGEECTRVLQQGVTSAIAQHGPFDGTDAAAAFAETWLVGASRGKLADDLASGLLRMCPARRRRGDRMDSERPR
jgi:hypothetical protein